MKRKLAFLLGTFVTGAATGQETRRIEDNSFLLEEAYNQEAGVVQHISTFAKPRGSGEWGYALTTEWPLTGQRHQLSYTLSLVRAQTGSGLATGLGDVAINYRLQAIGGENARFWLAPRLTVIAPVGSADLGRGNGRLGLEVGIPASMTLAPWLTGHFNVGLTGYPGASGAGRIGTTARAARVGGSLIVDLSPKINLLVETLFESRRVVSGFGATVVAESWVVNPGVRWAFDFASGLQIVPGVAYTIGAGPSKGEDGLFLYLSFEYSFKKQ